MEALSAQIEESGRVIAFTGAGISTASGLPDFRGDAGIWDRIDPTDLSIHTLEREPTTFWESWVELYEAFFEDAEAAPNAAHEALARMVEDDIVSAIITQNADGLHQAAGTPPSSVVELHGTARTTTCLGCARSEPVAETVERIRAGELPPQCPACGGGLEPDAVLFGERLPEDAFRRSRRLTVESDLFLVVGSSLTVEPAASLPALAVETGGTLAIDNLEETPLDEVADFRFDRPAEEFLPDLESRLYNGENRPYNGE